MGRKRRKATNGRVHKYSIEKPYPVKLISKLREEVIAQGKSDIVLDGDVINIRSLRLDNFFEHGFKCVNCGIEGVHFIKEKGTLKEKWHINLYAIKEDGTEVLMTKDHIYPKSLGGEDVIVNVRPCCSRCNGKKGSNIEGITLEDVIPLADWVRSTEGTQIERAFFVWRKL